MKVLEDAGAAIRRDQPGRHGRGRLPVHVRAHHRDGQEQRAECPLKEEDGLRHVEHLLRDGPLVHVRNCVIGIDLNSVKINFICAKPKKAELNILLYGFEAP